MSDDFRSEAEIFENLPSAPEDAFLLLEEHFRKECELQIARDQNESPRVHQVNYIAQVLGAITELGLSPEFENRFPAIQDVDYQTYLNFSKDVKHFCTILLIRRGRRAQGNSVSFDPATKAKINHLLNQASEIFTKLDIDEKKRDALLSKLAALQIEVNKNRTRFDSYAALAIETAVATGDVIEKSKILELLNSVARIFGTAKQEEQTKQLPAPTRPKQIEHQKPVSKPNRPPTTTKRGDLDDEIPF